ncbi:MAG: hypothetical protein AB7G28_09485 [Pirellulales bacterium]
MIDFSHKATDAGDVLAVRRFRRALRMLLDAREFAARTASSPWEFAVEIDLLQRLGLTQNDLRYLVRSRHLEHAVEETVAGKGARSFRQICSADFEEQSCFVLTSLGADAACDAFQKIRSRARTNSPAEKDTGATLASAPPKRPSWDAARRILLWENQIVKSFRRRAINQELVLGAFQEESWPPRIDDPLAPQPCQDMKRRLNDTIKCLNRGQVHPLLHFRGDGSGEGVLWEVVG